MIRPKTSSRPQRQRATSSACKVPHTANPTTHLPYPPPAPPNPINPSGSPQRSLKARTTVSISAQVSEMTAGGKQSLPSSVYARIHSIHHSPKLPHSHTATYFSAHHSHDNYHPSSQGSNNPAYNHPTHNRNSHPSTPPRRTARHLPDVAHNP